MEKGIEKAAEIIKGGGIVGFPTESFYGLATDATNPYSVQRLFDIKKRQPDQPILILIPSLTELSRCTAFIPLQGKKLAEKFWPGGLTLVFYASTSLPPILTAGTGKVGIRVSSNPVAQALCRKSGIPITGTSANVSEHPPCNSAREVVKYFQKKVDLVLDGGDTEGKFPSTVLDITVNPPLVIREGIVTRGSIIKTGIYEQLAPASTKKLSEGCRENH